MAPTLHNHLDTIAAAIARLDRTLQLVPVVGEFLTDAETDVKFINSQVSEVQLLFCSLSKYRATLLRSLNLRVSPICKLPPEILGEIFKYACSSGSKKFTTPMRIGAICNHWRQVAWSVPQLWTELIVGERIWKPSHETTLLDLYFKNVGGLHCHMTLLGVPDEKDKGLRGIPHEGVFDQLFVKHPDKLKTLTFHNFPESWIPHISSVTESGQGLPNLESLAILDDDYENPLIDLALPPSAFYNVPRLRKLVLEGVHTLTFPWAQLTELSLRGVFCAVALNIVLYCENLITLKLDDLFESDDVVVPRPNKSTVFRNLRELTFTSPKLSARWERALIKYLLFTTSLRWLTWVTEDGTKNLRKAFLLRLPPSITLLELDCCGERDSVQDLEIIFARLTSLRSVTLHLDGPLDLEVVRLFMTTDRRRSLPSLRSIGFIMMRSEYNPQYISDLLDIVRSRWVAQDGRDMFEGFRFRFPVAERKSPSWIYNFKREVDSILRGEV